MSERPRMEADVVIVGAGPSGLACALQLARLMDRHNEGGQGPALSKENILVLEKGRAVGAHQLSGAILDPRALAELEPSFAEDASLGSRLGLIPVQDDALMVLTPQHAMRTPVEPPPLRNHGNYIVSLNRLVNWLAEKVEASGISIFPATAGRELLFEGPRVVGVRTDDKGVDREGRPQSNYEPGSDIIAPITVLAEGPRGSLARELAGHNHLAGANPQVYSLGIKEVWQLPAGRFPRGRVLHTLGWPLPQDMYGGGWLYGLDDDQLSLGLMVGLEYGDPATDPHNLFQRFKTHPWLRALLDGGEMLRYGAKTTPMGGWYALAPLAGEGWLEIGDTAGFLNSQRLKGIHLALKSGMLAAETILATMTGQGTLAGYGERVNASWIREELWPVRNFHQGFEHGLIAGLAHGAVQMATGGRGLHARYPAIAGHLKLVPVDPLAPLPARTPADGHLTFDKLTAVFHSGTRHEEDQPCHLLISDTDICSTRCRREYGNPCQYFCPAAVYEMVPGDDGAPRLHLNPSNCVHCKTCDIMDPYQIITWVPPEGGGGPSY